MNHYRVTLLGDTPLIMHKDNLKFAEDVKRWTKDPANKSKSVAGDDRTPAWTWIGCLYKDDVTRTIGMDSDNLMTCVREGGKKVPDPLGNKKATMMRATQYGLTWDNVSFPLFVNGKQVSLEPINALIGEEDFSKHNEIAESLGFELFVKRAQIQGKKHVRVRPLFRNWSMVGTLTIPDESSSHLTKDVLKNVLDYAGLFAGLGDWRPSSKTPGQYGKFTVELETI